MSQTVRPVVDELDTPGPLDEAGVPDDAAPSGPRSDVEALLAVFLQHTKSDEQITRGLRALVGLERPSTQANGIRKPHASSPRSG